MMKRCTKANYKNPKFWNSLKDGDTLTISDAVPMLPMKPHILAKLQESYNLRLSYVDGCWRVQK